MRFNNRNRLVFDLILWIIQYNRSKPPQFANKFFSERNIEMTVKSVSATNFDEAVVNHAIETKSDLIAIMNLHKNSIFGTLTSGHEPYIINNEAGLSSLIVNPMDSPYGASVLFS